MYTLTQRLDIPACRAGPGAQEKAGGRDVWSRVPVIQKEPAAGRGHGPRNTPRALPAAARAIRGRRMTKPDPLRPAAGEMKTHIYSSLYSINHAFQEITEHLQRLEDRRTIAPAFAESQRAAIEESRAGINRAILGSMLTTELDDWAYFGRLKIALESGEKTDGPELIGKP